MPVFTTETNVREKFQLADTTLVPAALVTRNIDDAHTILLRFLDPAFDVPLPEDALVKLYKGKQPGDHMRNFFECIKTREQPISDVHTHHRAMTTCHLANIAIRLGRKLVWDPEKEQIVGDADAAKFVRREQRKGYEITV